MNDMDRNMELLQLLSLPEENNKEDVKQKVKSTGKILKKSPKLKKIRKKVELSEADLELRRLDQEINREKKMEMRKEKQMERERRREARMLKKKPPVIKVSAPPKVKKPVTPKLKITSISTRERKAPIDPSNIPEEFKIFMCQICLIFPRPDSINKSELYRHYSLKHYAEEIKRDYLQPHESSPCPYCPDDKKKILKKGGFDISHMGQTHLLVENYLQESWKISDEVRRRSSSSWKPALAVRNEDIRESKEEVKFAPSRMTPILDTRFRNEEKTVETKEESLFVAINVDTNYVKDDDDDVVEIDEEELEQKPVSVTETRTRSGRVSKAPSDFRSALVKNISKARGPRTRRLNKENIIIVEDENENVRKRKADSDDDIVEVDNKVTRRRSMRLRM